MYLRMQLLLVMWRIPFCHSAYCDKGFLLSLYEGSKEYKTSCINFDDYANEKTGHGVIPMADIQRQVIQQLFGSSKITSIKPDKFEFYFNYGRSKKTYTYVLDI